MSIKSEFFDWLDNYYLNVSSTVTLKQALMMPQKEGKYSLRSIQPDDMKKTGWLLRDRFLKKLFGTRNYKNKRLPAFLVFVEGDKFKRFHLHILTKKPAEISDLEFENIFKSTAWNLDWVYTEIKIKDITYNTPREVIKYDLKTGIDAFISEASFIPQFA